MSHPATYMEEPDPGGQPAPTPRPRRLPGGEAPVPLPRRSARERTRPKWQTTGEYVMAAPAEPDWKERAEYLSSLLTQGIFATARNKATEALMDLVTGKHT